MNDGNLALLMILLLAWGIFGLACSLSCAVYSIKNSSTTWYKIAGWVVIANTVITFLAGILTH
jgi:hypothetical protein